MQDNSPSQHVQEACPSRCTLPYSRRPATLPPLPPPPVPLSPLRPPKRSVSPLRGEAETGEEQMGESCGSKEGFARLRFEERRLAVRRVRGDFRCVEKTGHLSSWQRSQSGGRISGLETIVIIKVSSFTPCASLRLCFSLSLFFSLNISAYLTYRSASWGAERRLEAGRGGRAEQPRRREDGIGAERGVCLCLPISTSSLTAAGLSVSRSFRSEWVLQTHTHSFVMQLFYVDTFQEYQELHSCCFRHYFFYIFTFTCFTMFYLDRLV